MRNINFLKVSFLAFIIFSSGLSQAQDNPYNAIEVEIFVIEMSKGLIGPSSANITEKARFRGSDIEKYLELSSSSNSFSPQNSTSRITGEVFEGSNKVLECPSEILLKNTGKVLAINDRETELTFNRRFEANDRNGTCYYQVTESEGNKDIIYKASLFLELKEGVQSQSGQEQVDNSGRSFGEKVREFVGNIFKGSNDSQGNEQ